MSEGSAHAQPYYCPYCGEQDLRPGGQEGSTHCRTCDRLWTLRYLRLGDTEEG